MKVLLDECVNHRLRPLIVDHDVFTASFMGWAGIRNGRLLSAAVTSGFDCMVTNDHEMEFQQNLKTLPLSVYVLFAASNKLADLQPLVANLLAALATPPCAPAVVHVRL